MKRVLSAVLVASVFLVGNAGCADKPPKKNEIRITTPAGTTVTIERPAEAADRNPPPVSP